MEAPGPAKRLRLVTWLLPTGYLITGYLVTGYQKNTPNNRHPNSLERRGDARQARTQTQNKILKDLSQNQKGQDTSYTDPSGNTHDAWRGRSQYLAGAPTTPIPPATGDPGNNEMRGVYRHEAGCPE